MWDFLSLCSTVDPGREPEPLIHSCSASESSTELSQRRGKLRAIAQRERCKVTYQQNSSLPPQDSSLVCSGHAFQQNYNEEGAICEESVEHNSLHQTERPREQTGICRWEGVLSADS